MDGASTGVPLKIREMLEKYGTVEGQLHAEASRRSKRALIQQRQYRLGERCRVREGVPEGAEPRPHRRRHGPLQVGVPLARG